MRITGAELFVKALLAEIIAPCLFWHPERFSACAATGFNAVWLKKNIYLT